MDSTQIQNTIKSPLGKKRASIIIFILLVVFFAIASLVGAPYGYTPSVIHISRGESLKTITEELKTKGVVRSPAVLQTFVLLFQSGKVIPVGDYYFNGEPVWKVAYMLARGDHHIVPIKVTFPEGSTNEQFASILSRRIPEFDANLFINAVKDKQGYLFPDTYFFFPKTTQDEIVDALESDYSKRIGNLSSDFSKSNRSKKDIIIMASILEGEARGTVDAGLISGILWKRLDRGMPLQVDVDRDTYKKKGLPTNPLSNPGVESIRAALGPVQSPYFYYLHDKSGTMHFAVTYSEHKNNIKKYLK